MIQTFKEGGWPMWALLVLGAVTIATAFRFALRPSGDQPGFLHAMGRAVLFTTLMGFFSDWVTVAHAVDRGIADKMTDYERWQLLIQAIGECTAPLVLGFSELAVVAILVAVGQRKLDAKAV